MLKKDLEELLKTQEVIENLVLAKELGNLLANIYSDTVDYHNFDRIFLSVESMRYLLEHGLRVQEAFNAVMRMDAGEGRDQLFEFILTKDIDFDAMYSLPSSISENELNRCIAKKLPINQAAKLILSISNYYSDTNPVISKDIEQQIKLVEFLLTKNANFSEVYFIPKYLPLDLCARLLEHGLRADAILRASQILTVSSAQDTLLDFALAKGANINAIYFSEPVSKEQLHKLLDKGLLPSKALDLVLNMHSSNMEAQAFKELQRDLIELAIDRGADINSLERLSNLDHAKYLLTKGLKVENLIKPIINQLRIDYNPENEQYRAAQLTEQQKTYLDLAKQAGADFNKIFAEELLITYTTSVDGVVKPQVIPEAILQIFIQNYAVAPILVLKYAANNKLVALVKFVIANNQIEPSLKEYVELYVGSRNFKIKVKIVKEFSSIYNEAEVRDYARSNGASELETNSAIKVHEFINEYILTKNGSATTLGELELNILDGKVDLSDIANYKNAKFTNQYGLGALHLALTADRYDLAKEMVRAGFDIYAKNNYGMMPLNIISANSNEAMDSGLPDFRTFLNVKSSSALFSAG